MEKRYQVFVSSTYEDLKEERNEVMKALLELKCIPTAMELFPAADENSWSYITQVIDECDYYVLIIGGRYGSLDSSGISYTEREYRYAAQTNKPRLVFLYEDISKLPVNKTDQDEIKRKKLDNFIAYLQTERNFKKWSNADQLGAVLSRSMTQLKESRPAVGWVRADHIPEAQKDEIIRLREKIEELEKALAKLDSAPIDSSEWAFGSDKHQLQFFVSSSPTQYRDPRPAIKKKRKIDLSWDEIFQVLAPQMTVPVSIDVIRNKLASYCKMLETHWIQKQKIPDGYGPYSVTLHVTDFGAIKVQFLTLGLIEESIKPKAENSAQKILWKLSPRGLQYMRDVIAQRKQKTDC